jgi:adenylate cyclase
MTDPNDVEKPTAGRGISLRLALQMMLSSAVIVAVGAVTLLINYEVDEVLHDLADSHVRIIAGGTAASINQQLAHVPRALEEFDFLRDLGDLDLGDHDDIVSHLKFQAAVLVPGTMIGYASRDGMTYTLARADRHGAHVVAGAKPEILGLDIKTIGAAAGAENGSSTASYLDDDWFLLGLQAEKPAWTPTYRFSDGRMGISAVVNYHAPGNHEASGVFHVDLPLDELGNWLDSIELTVDGGAFLVRRDGTLLVAPKFRDTTRIEPETAIKMGVEALGSEFSAIKPGGIVSTNVDVKGEHYFVALIEADIVDGLDWVVGVIVAEDDYLNLAFERMAATAVFAAAATVIVLIFGTLFATWVATPLRRIASELGEVSRMRISDAPLPPSRVREVTMLGHALGSMKSALRSLERYVPPEVARRLVVSGEAAAIGVEKRRLSIYVSDIAGFTGITEKMEPDLLVKELNAYFDDMTQVIRDQKGTVDKFMGDGVLAFFNAPSDVPDHAAMACRAALESIRATEAVVAERERDGRPVFRIRVGLAIGDVLVGNVGSSERFGYTVIGDSVNVASRLEPVNKLYGTRIIASDELRADAGTGFEWRRLDRIAVYGREGGLPISELLGLSGEIPSDRLEARDHYEAALDEYYAGNFSDAARLFQTLAEERADDTAAGFMAARAREMAAEPPVGQWDGVFVLHEK